MEGRERFGGLPRDPQRVRQRELLAVAQPFRNRAAEQVRHHEIVRRLAQLRRQDRNQMRVLNAAANFGLAAKKIQGERPSVAAAVEDLHGVSRRSVAAACGSGAVDRRRCSLGNHALQHPATETPG